MKIPRLVKFILIGVVLIFLGLVLFHTNSSSDTSSQVTTFWKITAIDTMKYSRDSAGDQDVLIQIPLYVGEIAALHPSYIAIDTPYDEQFYPVLNAWVDEARRNHLHVWFRGNFSSWEGWFGYQKFSNPNEHLQLTKKFITSHPELFQDGDIFSPVPEAENGGFGDPRQNGKVDEFNTFLQNSYATCTDAFKQINKKVDCGYFSVNGDIAKEVLTPETVAKTGNRVVIDHYIDSPQQMAEDLDYLHNKFPQAKIVLGEFGAPIPDINGDMNDNEQADFIKSLLNVFVSRRSYVEGMDYWTFLGSSTALFTDSNEPKPVAQTLATYFKPPVVTGRVVDTLGSAVSDVVLSSPNGTVTKTDSKGYFAFVGLPGNTLQVTFTKTGYDILQKKITISNSNNKLQDIKITPKNTNWLYKLRILFQIF